MAPSTQGTMPFDIATAIEEIANGHRQISLLRALAAVTQPGGAWPENAEELFDGVMKSLAVALSTLNPVAKQIPHRQSETAELRYPSPSSSWRSERPPRKRKDAPTRNKNDLSRKRVLTDSWTITSSKPMDDSYQWRKYGEKKIHGARFPRCYYRCAYREDEGCQAMKHVQQADNSNPPKFVVTNIRQHTCTMAKIVPMRGFAIVAANSSSPPSDQGSRYFGDRQRGCIPSASPAAETQFLDLNALEDERCDCLPAGCGAQPDEEGCEQAAEVASEEPYGALDMSDVMASNVLYPMSPCTMHMELTADLGATAAGALEYLDDLWLF